MKTGIVGYGIYVPKLRLKVEEIWDMWQRGFPPSSIKQLYGVEAKAVARWDEDVITMAVDAAKASLVLSDVAPTKIGALFLGTSTNAYVTKASAPIIAESLGLGHDVMCSDLQFAGKSGTTALQIGIGLTEAGVVQHALAIGCDALSRHVAPNDIPLEYVAGSGGAAYVVGTEGVIAQTENMYSYTTDTPDFFRLDGDRYIKRAVSSTEEWIGYSEHVREAIKRFNDRCGYALKDFDYAVFSQPDGKIAMKIGAQIGFTSEQMAPGLISRKIGDCGSASPLIGLAAVLDIANAGKRILVCSYGYGGGCDVLCLKTTDHLEILRKSGFYMTVKEIVDDGTEIDFKQYLRMERKIIQEYL